jgi:hypothetical protein
MTLYARSAEGCDRGSDSMLGNDLKAAPQNELKRFYVIAAAGLRADQCA